MQDFGKKIFFYVIKAILPYFFAAWAFLTVVLFVQQASRYSEIFFSPNIPAFLIWQLAFALLPSVIAFTCPMAVLVGVLTGLAKMRVDGELTAIKASGVSNLQIFLPIVFLGLVFSIFAFFVNWKGVPWTAKVVRQIALRTALEKIKSPIEPGVFSTEIPAVTIYVGKIQGNSWGNIIIFDRSQSFLRLITSEKGRLNLITSDADEIEIRLEQAQIYSIPENSEQKVSVEKAGEIGFKAKTKKKELIERLGKEADSMEELGLGELKAMSESEDEKSRTEAQILLNRRILLSFTPLLFAIVGVVLELENKQKGRGISLAKAFIVLAAFYLTGLLGEQMARAGQISPTIGTLLPIITTTALIAVSSLPISREAIKQRLKRNLANSTQPKNNEEKPTILTYPLAFSISSKASKDIAISTIKLFTLTMAFFTTIYLVFTAFELWKFVGRDGRFGMLLEYLFNLIPLVYLQLSPSCFLIAVLATLTVKSRQNEIVAWMNAGQSIYKLTAPCLLLGVLLGLANLVIQETIAPKTNQRQDILRSEMRSKNAFAVGKERIWLTDDNKIYSFSPVKQNERFYIFELSDRKLKSAIIAQHASVEEKRITLQGQTQKIIFSEENASAQITSLSEQEKIITDVPELLKQAYSKPTHLTIGEIKEKRDQSISDAEKQMYSVALEKRYTTPLLPTLAALVAIPFGFSARKQKNKSLLAVGIWLIFIWFANFLEQTGTSGQISAKTAVWIPIVMFMAIGTYLISQTKT